MSDSRSMSRGHLPRTPAAPSTVSPQLAPRPFEADDLSPSTTGEARILHNFSNVAVTAPVQAKLTVGQPGDPYEQEADRIADQVMVMPDPGQAQVQRMQEPEEEELQMKPLGNTIQRMEIPEEEELQMKPLGDSIQRMEIPEEEELQMKPLGNSIQRMPEEEEELQMKAADASAQVASPSLETSLNQSKGGGTALDDATRSFVEPRMGFDFSQVRIHNDSQAVQMNQQLGARAFTHGSDIYFGAGQYNPGSDDGKRLLSHELTHVVQQTSGIHCQLIPNLQADEPEPRTDPQLDQLIGLRNTMQFTLVWPARAYQQRIEACRSPLERVLGRISRNYTTAWENHNRILRAARVDAENENFVRGIIVGAAASVLIAMVAEGGLALVGIEALTPFSGGWWATQSISAGTSSGLGAAAADYLSAPTNFDLGIPREFGEIRQLHQLLTFERRVSSAHLTLSNVHAKLHILNTIIDEIQAGRGQDVTSEVAGFLNNRSSIESLPGAYSAAWQGAASFEERLEEFSVPSARTMERAIWVHWIGSLSNSDHDLLDRDALEDYLHGSIGVLGSGGLLGVDTRAIFDTDLELAAIRAARSRRSEILQSLSAPSL